MRTAVISDIHGNVEALTAVLADIEARGIERVVCLGDIVGYGPDPLACVDLVRERCVWALMGNHDFGVLYEPTNFNPAAEQSAYWTREQFDAEPDQALRAARYDFLGRLRVRVVEELAGDGVPFLAVHASPRRPINEYVFAEDVTNAPEKIEAIFERIERVALVGHTHVPGVFTDEPDVYPPGELGPEGEFRIGTVSAGADDGAEKVLINVGSVGQPRDKDPRACYAEVSSGSVRFHRVAYDAKATSDKIRAIPELNDFLADRLLEGR